MRYFLILFIFINLGCITKVTQCPKTHWGNEHIVYSIELFPIKKVKGTITDEYGDPLAGALVELYEYEKETEKIGSLHSFLLSLKKMGCCFTNEKGEFYLKGYKIKSGKYELRVSINGYKTTSAVIVLKRNFKGIVYPLEIFLKIDK